MLPLAPDKGADWLTQRNGTQRNSGAAPTPNGRQRQWLESACRNGYDGRDRRRHEDGQGASEVEQGSAQAEEGEGEDDRRESVAKRQLGRAGAFEERLIRRAAVLWVDP